MWIARDQYLAGISVDLSVGRINQSAALNGWKRVADGKAGGKPRSTDISARLD